MPRRDGGHQEQHLKILAEAGDERVVLVLLRRGQRPVQPLRGLAQPPRGQIAQRQPAVHEIPRRGGDEPRIQLQRRLHRGDGPLILLFQQQVGDAAGLDHEIGERQIGQRVRPSLCPQGGAPRLHHQPQQIAPHRLHHVAPDAGALQKSVALRLVLQIVHRPLQPRHVRAVDGVDAQQQRRAVGGRGVLPLLRQERRLIGLDVRLLEPPLHGVGLAPIDLRRAGGVSVGQPVIALEHLRQPVRRGHHLPRLRVKQIPHGRAPEEKRLLRDKQL